MEELLEPRDTKFVIFSQWERMLKLADVSIKDIVVKNGAESAIFSGSLSLVKRAETLRRFNDDPMLRVLFSTDAGGVGLNLQEAASTVMNLEMPWNPAVLEQRIARVHRPGQKRTVNVVNFISTECIEEKVYDAICNKKALFDGVFNGMTDKVIFDKGSSFIDRLKGMIDEDEQTAGSADVQADGPAAETADAASREETAKGPENAGTRASAEQSPASSGVSVPVPSAGNGRADGGPGGPETYRTIDLSGILKALGTWVGRPEIASLGDGQLKLKVKEEDGEIKLSLAKPPKELLTGIKNAFLEIFA
jgi:superfamily II DNA/RNA helicase